MNQFKLNGLTPDWHLPSHVKAFMTTRQGGISHTPFNTLNLGDHVDDTPQAVETNRAILQKQLNLPSIPAWLIQTHSTVVADINQTSYPKEADACFTSIKNQVCVVMTADCLPVLFSDINGTVVAAAHAGWRGLQAGILEKTIDAMNVPTNSIHAWMGAAIGPNAFEVGKDVYDAFTTTNPEAHRAFKSTQPEKWLVDIYQLARMKMQKKGVQHIYGGGLCTFNDDDNFYSYRREGKTGRMASLIWME